MWHVAVRPFELPSVLSQSVLNYAVMQCIHRHSHRADEYDDDDDDDDDDDHNDIMLQLVLHSMSCITKVVPVSSQKFPITKPHSQCVASHDSASQSSYTCVQLQHNSVKLVAASVYQDV